MSWQEPAVGQRATWTRTFGPDAVEAFEGTSAIGTRSTSTRTSRRPPGCSTAISELAPPGTAGSALAIQTALGFILTGVTILVVGALAPTDGGTWRSAFAILAIGPLVGIVAMGRLRRRSDAGLMANGHR